LHHHRSVILSERSESKDLRLFLRSEGESKACPALSEAEGDLRLLFDLLSICSVRSHPCGKDKYAARMGHPELTLTLKMLYIFTA
jgi:hypothetical protein